MVPPCLPWVFTIFTTPDSFTKCMCYYLPAWSLESTLQSQTQTHTTDSLPPKASPYYEPLTPLKCAANSLLAQIFSILYNPKTLPNLCTLCYLLKLLFYRRQGLKDSIHALRNQLRIHKTKRATTVSVLKAARIEIHVSVFIRLRLDRSHAWLYDFYLRIVKCSAWM